MIQVSLKLKCKVSIWNKHKVYNLEKTRLNNNSVQPSDSSVSIQSISDEIKLANEDQKLQYYLNIAKGIKLSVI